MAITNNRAVEGWSSALLQADWVFDGPFSNQLLSLHFLEKTALSAATVGPSFICVMVNPVRLGGFQLRRSIFVILSAVVILSVSGCGGAPSVTDLLVTEDALEISEGLLKLDFKQTPVTVQAEYTLEWKGQEELAELELSIPVISDVEITGVSVEVNGEKSPVKGSFVDLTSPLSPNQKLQISISYQLDKILVPQSKASASWRVPVLGLKHSVMHTGQKNFSIYVAIPDNVKFKSSTPTGLNATSLTEIQGSMDSVPNILIIEVTGR